jgi:short-subunit dehydrogenase
MSSSDSSPIALITGGSIGIGFEIACEFGRHGYAVILCAQNPDHLASAAASLASKGITSIHTVEADLSTRDGVEAVYEAAVRYGPIDVLVANAGIGPYGDFATETDLDEELQTVQLNVASVVHLTKLIAADMVERGGGKIMITSSIMAHLPDPFQTVYAASKAFTYVFAEGLREALRDRNVTVTVLAPGFTDTSFFRKSGASRSRAVRGILMRKGDPADVAAAAFDALERGKDHAIPGVINRIIASAGRIVPDPLIARIVRAVLQPVQ